MSTQFHHDCQLSVKSLIRNYQLSTRERQQQWHISWNSLGGKSKLSCHDNTTGYQNMFSIKINLNIRSVVHVAHNEERLNDVNNSIGAIG